ncbi:MAG: nucleoside diphosphate kinase regulator [Candidatus Aegiribacteria sp.]|nr:nucleoside diphosphate kinase regulator [Candidatus Aegiribacteria sp.]
MKKRRIHISSFDKKRLMKFIDNCDSNHPDKKYLDELEKELNIGIIIKPKNVPPNVITMNSKVHLTDMDTGEKFTYMLVFPEDADLKAGKISILAPIGTALIGYSVGDIIEWNVPAGLRRLKVEEIPYQPEAAGHFHL